MQISFTHIPPPGKDARSAEYYQRGYAWGKDALQRYGVEACANFRKSWGDTRSSYERGAIDAFDNKPDKYGKGSGA